MSRPLILAMLTLLAAGQGGQEGLSLTVDAPWASEVHIWRVEPGGTWRRTFPAGLVVLPPGFEYRVTAVNLVKRLRSDAILTGLVTKGQRVTVRPSPRPLQRLRLSAGPGVTRVDSGVQRLYGFAVHVALAPPDGRPRVLDSSTPNDGHGEVLCWAGGRTWLRATTAAGPWFAKAHAWPEDLPFRLETPPVVPLTVLDTAGKPVPGAHVELLGEGDVVQAGGSYKSGFPIHVGIADAKGRILIRKDDIGDRLIWATAWGYAPARARKEGGRLVARLSPIETVTIPVKPAPAPGTVSAAHAMTHPLATAGGYRVPLSTGGRLTLWGSGGLFAEAEIEKGAVLRPQEPQRVRLSSDPPDPSVRFDLAPLHRSHLVYETLRGVAPGSVLLPARWGFRARMSGEGLSPVTISYRFPDKPGSVVLPMVKGLRTAVVVTDPKGRALPWVHVYFSIKLAEVPDVIEAGVARVVTNRGVLTDEKGRAETLAPEGSEMWVMVRSPDLPRTRIDLKAGQTGKIVVDPPSWLVVRGEPGEYRIEAEPKPGTVLGLWGVWGDGTSKNDVTMRLERRDASDRLVLGPLPAGRYVVSRDGKRAEARLGPGESVEVRLR